MSKEFDRCFLEGENIYLRPLELEDITDEYMDWLNDAEMSRFIPSFAFPQTRKDVENYVGSFLEDRNTVFLAIIEKETGKHVGNIKLGPISWLNRKAEYGRMLGKTKTRSKGYGTEAAKLVIKYAFEVLNLNKVTAGCLATNKGAIRSNEKAGLKVEGVLRQEEYVWGEYVDGIRMGITRDDYNQSDD